MVINVPRGGKDRIVDQIIEVLSTFQTDYPSSEIDVYRQNSVSVRIRIIYNGFADQCRTERSKLVWSYLKQLPDEVQSDISTVLLLTPEEKEGSFANFEFDDPIPSKL